MSVHAELWPQMIDSCGNLLDVAVVDSPRCVVRLLAQDNRVGYLADLMDRPPESALDTDLPSLCWFGPGQGRTFEEALALITH